jgi:hypothetical protein
VETITATSPDGRSWKIDAIKEPFTFPRSYVAATVVVVGIAVFLAFVSWYFAVGLAVILVIWLSERISNHLRPRFRARTEGPPPEELTWKATTFARRELEQRIARTVAAGNVVLEPRGLKLLSHQGHLTVDAKEAPTGGSA